MPRRRRPNLSLQMVVDAAARVLEREGYEGLTMRAVADDLGVQAPAIYWHVKDKQALELALFDHLMKGLTFAPAGDDWRQDVRRMAQALRARLTRHRDICRLMPDGFFITPNSMSLLNTALGVLLEAGLAPQDAGYGFTVCFNYVSSWSRGEGQMRARPAGVRPGLDAEAKAALESGAFPNFAAVSASFLEGADLDAQFAFGLDLLIAGLERLVPDPST
jgi:TetR/AcrR family transcriptional regulator, tetracycline repressor protein